MATRSGAPNTPPNGPPPANPQSAPNLVHFDPKNAVPQQPVYFQRNDVISFNVLTNGTIGILRVNYRWLTPEGEIKEGEFDTIGISGSLFFTLPLYEGWLLSFAARITSGAIVGQWMFLQAFITRFGSVQLTAPQQGMIWQGFVYNGSSNGWPGTPSKDITDGPGTIRSVTGTAPAAGAEINEVVPLQRRWQLLSFFFSLTTSATVANRVTEATLSDGVNTFYRSSQNTNQVASSTITFSLAPGFTTQIDVQPSPFSTSVMGIPPPSLLKSSFKISTKTTALQAGDQYTAPQYLILEWGQWDS